MDHSIAVNDRNRLTILRSLETSAGAIVNDFQQNEMHCKLNPMGRKAAIFHSAWRYSGTETNRSIPAIAFQIFNLFKPGKKQKS